METLAPRFTGARRRFDEDTRSTLGRNPPLRVPVSLGRQPLVNTRSTLALDEADASGRPHVRSREQGMVPFRDVVRVKSCGDVTT